MRRIFVALATTPGAACAEKSPPLDTPIDDVLRPVTDTYGKQADNLLNELFTVSKIHLSEAAHASLNANVYENTRPIV